MICGECGHEMHPPRPCQECARQRRDVRRQGAVKEFIKAKLELTKAGFDREMTNSPKTPDLSDVLRGRFQNGGPLLPTDRREE